MKTEKKSLTQGVIQGLVHLSMVGGSMLFLPLTSWAEKITCPVGIIKATVDAEDEKKIGENGNVELNLDKEGSGEGSIVITTKQGQKAEVSMLVHKAEAVKGIYAFDVVTLLNDKRETMQGFLTMDVGVSSGSGWDIGPKGSTILKLLYPNSLSEKPIDFRLTAKAFQILKKYGITASQENSNMYYIFQAVTKAIKAKELKEGEYIGTFFLFGCWKQ